MWSVSLVRVRYSAKIVNWRKDKVRRMDMKIRKLMKIYRSLHPRADID